MKLRRSSSAAAKPVLALRRIGLAGGGSSDSSDGRPWRRAAAATAGAAAPLEAVLATATFRLGELAAACVARASCERMEQLDGIAVELRGCPRPIEWIKERQDGEQEQGHEVGQCDGNFFNKNPLQSGPEFRRMHGRLQIRNLLILIFLG